MSDSLDARTQVLITAAELSDLTQADRPVTILDVRWRLDQPDGHAAYLQGHIPGAVYVSLEDELSDLRLRGWGALVDLRGPLRSRRFSREPTGPSSSSAPSRSNSSAMMSARPET